MTAVASSLPPVSWQEQFKADIAAGALAQIPDSSTEELRIWAFENCGKPVESLQQLAPSGLTQDKWDEIFIDAVHNTIKCIVTKRLQFMNLQSMCELGERILELTGKQPAADCKQSCTEAETEDGFVVVELEPSTSDKIKLLKTWLNNPALVLSKEILTGSSRYS